MSHAIAALCSRKQPLLKGLFAFVLAVICIVPVGAILVQGMGAADAVWQHVQDNLLGQAIGNTLLIVGATAFASGVLGTGFAWLTVAYRFPLSRILTLLFPFSLAIPSYIAAISYGSVLEFAGPVQTFLRTYGWDARWLSQIRSVWGAVFIFTLCLYPYVFLLARASFMRLSANFLDAARSLGARRVFIRVVLPLTYPSLVGATLLVVMEVMADYGTAHMFGVDTITTTLFHAWFYLQSPIVAAKIAVGILGVALVLLWMQRFYQRQQRMNLANAYRPIAPKRLVGVKAYSAMLGGVVLIGLSFVIPVAELIRRMVYAPERQWQDFMPAVHSALLAVTVAICIIMLSLVIYFISRGLPRFMQGFLIESARLGYALPGAILASGVMLCVMGQASFLIGGFALLLYALIIRFLAIGVNATHTGFDRVTPELEMAARTLGCTPRRAFMRVTIPLASPALLAGAVMIGVDIIKELPIILILRPFDVTPLAVNVFLLAGDDKLTEAAPLALGMIAVSVIAMCSLNKSRVS